MNILLVEDDQKMASSIKQGLEQYSHQVEIEDNGESGYKKALAGSFDVIIFDLMLPQKDGFEAIKALRDEGVLTPILILSAKNLVSDKVKGLNIGGDDYLSKPFSFSELLARLESLTRRFHRQQPTIERHVDDLTINIETRKTFRSGKEIDLQPREFELLRYLIDNQNTIVTKSMIIKNVWNYNFAPNTNIVETRMCKLRDKIDRDFPKKLIHTLRGVGYVLKAD